MTRYVLGTLAFAGGLLAIQVVNGQQLDPAAAFRFGDKNKDGKLSFDEFQALTAKNQKFKDDPNLAKLVFNRLDTKNTGFLTLDEFKKIADLGGGKGAAKADPPGKKDPAPPVGASASFADKPTQEQIAFFEKKIRPVLVDHCYQCHSADAEKIKGELHLDTREGTRKGGASGPSIVPGNPDKSLLIKGLRHKDPDTAMPPKGKLPDAVIADFEAWVKMGAPDPREGKAVASNKYVVDIEKGRSFWAFVAPKAPAIPQVPNPRFEVRNEIDLFILAGLEKKGIKPVGDADKRTLIRRVFLDLTGLPPSGEDVEAFVADSAPNAFEKVVDKLLASPQFGERWGRHWLDIARYAESSGKTANFNYPHAWRYRDYVIAAFNSDKPYDQFIKEQLAGDLLKGGDAKTKAERLIATGFLAIGPKALNERDGLQFELDVADEQIDVTTQAFLGITAACARCHDHKFDPIPTKDYYALAGIFRSTETCYGTVRFVQSQRPSPLLQLPEDSAPSAITKKLSAEERTATEKEIADLRKKMAEAKDPIMNIFTSAQLALAQTKLDSYHSDGTPKLQAMGTRDKPERAGGFGFQPKGPRGPGFAGFGGSRSIDDSPIYNRGEPNQPSDTKVPRGTLQVMSMQPLKIKSGSGRLELAEWIASKDNPLTARVMVNRVWQHLFGRGIVSTADNFGAAGQPPTNPELLDHLAINFMENGWSVKKLVKRVVMSHAYQLDSKFDKAAFEVDPDNALIWRMSPRRLDAESLRDSMLAVSGQLDTTPPVGSVVAQAGEGPTNRPRLGGDQIGTAINDPRDKHRSVYLPIIRDNLPEALALFDAPDPSLITADRPTTTVPSQGLFILNNPFVIRSSEAAADKILKGTTTDTERIRAAYLAFYGRAPGEKELTTAEKFLTGFKAQLAKDKVPARNLERETWAAFCQALFASAEFQYRK